MQIKEIKFLTEATEDVRKIKYYLTGYEDAFIKLINRLNSCIKTIKNNPDIGRIGKREGTREFFAYNTEYIIVYRIKEEILEILTILHKSRKY